MMLERRAILQAIASAGVLTGMSIAGGISEAAESSRDSAAPTPTPTPTPDPAPCGESCAHGRTDVHAHYLPPPYKQALQQAGMVRADGGMMLPDWSAEAHLAMMETNGITTSVLSVSSPGLQFVDPSAAPRLARQINEAGARLCQDHPGRFGFFATLPVPDRIASVAEIGYAFDVLQADGVAMETNSKGLYLGDPGFAPIFEELNRRKAVLYLHPTSPQCLDQIGMGFPGPFLEFPFDTVRNTVSLLFSGTLRRCPDIKVILSHSGGALPSLVSRIALIADAPFIKPRPQGGSAEVIEEVRKLYFDIALSASPLNFQALLQITELSHLLYGSDYPFATPAAIATNTAHYDAFLAGLSPEHRQMVEYRNADVLFPRLRRFIHGASGTEL